MIQNLKSLNDQIALINELLGSTGGFVQKIQSTPISLILKVRAPGNSFFIHLGRGKGYEGLWFSEKNADPEFKIKDRFNDSIKKFSQGKKLSVIRCHSKQRAFLLDFGEDIIYFLYKGRVLYFGYSQREGSFKSWIGKKQVNDKENSSRTSVEDFFGPLIEGPEQSLNPQEVASIDELYDGIRSFKINKRKQKLLLRKSKELEEALNRITLSKKLQSEIPILEIEEIESRFREFSIKIKKKFNENDFQFKDRAFQKIKNFKNQASRFEEKKKVIDKEISSPTKEAILKKTITPFWKTQKKSNRKTELFDRYYFDRFQLGIGKSAEGNDQLRNSFGNSNDVWVHLEDQKSAHLIIKMKINEFDLQVAELLGSLMRDKMGLEDRELKLVYSELKNIRGLKGRAGAVTISKPNYFKVLYNPKWKEIISSD